MTSNFESRDNLLNVIIHDRLGIVITSNYLSLMTAGIQTRSHLFIKHISETSNNIRHGMHCSLSLIFDYEEEFHLSLEERLWDPESCDCLVNVVHWVWRDSHPWGQEHSELLTRIILESFFNCLRVCQIQLHKGNAFRLVCISSQNHCKLLNISWKRIKVCPIQYQSADRVYK